MKTQKYRINIPDKLFILPESAATYDKKKSAKSITNTVFYCVLILSKVYKTMWKD